MHREDAESTVKCRERLGCKDVKVGDVKIIPRLREPRNWDANIPSLPRVAMAEGLGHRAAHQDSNLALPHLARQQGDRSCRVA
ncbi:MAG: hypothetical protein ACREC3_06840 [Methyloceanibacter sp.]